MADDNNSATSKATNPDGSFVSLEDSIVLKRNTGDYSVPFQVLPTITENKGANYTDQTVLGRASPIKIYTGSAPRGFEIAIDYYIIVSEDSNKMVELLRNISASVYPKYSERYGPPDTWHFTMGIIDVDMICKTYNVTYNTDCWWDKDIMLPSHITIATSWEVVYAQEDLPGQGDIIGK